MQNTENPRADCVWPDKMPRLENRTAIVTGAGQGIGRALAIGFARKGAEGVIADVNEANAIAVRDEIQAAGGTALAMRTDVSHEDSVQSMLENPLREFRKVEILVNNAGIYALSSVKEMREEEWD
jgi:NAD(P)-dependent dehydrogenase (short-subunit alcohol dehydrogenase family)